MSSLGYKILFGFFGAFFSYWYVQEFWFSLESVVAFISFCVCFFVAVWSINCVVNVMGDFLDEA